MASRITPAVRVFLLVCVPLVVLFQSHVIRIFPSNTFSCSPVVVSSSRTWLGFASCFQNPIVVMGDGLLGSCPQVPINTQKRTEFGRQGCAAFGYPSRGGVLIKDPVDIVDMQYLQLERFKATQRSTNVLEEDAFCERMRRIGATWWPSEQDYNDVLLGVRERTELEARVLVFGWPEESTGVWLLSYESEMAKPRDFGKLQLAIDMNERCRMMQEFGATYYPDHGEVRELRGGS